MAKILIVGEDEDLRAVLRKALEGQGFEVGDSASVERGMEMALRSRWDMILLDVFLPGTGGIESCRKLREKGVDSHIMLLSVWNEAFLRRAARRAGVDDYVSKPFRLRELLDRVGKRLGKVKPQ